MPHSLFGKFIERGVSLMLKLSVAISLFLTKALMCQLSVHNIGADDVPMASAELNAGMAKIQHF